LDQAAAASTVEMARTMASSTRVKPPWALRFRWFMESPVEVMQEAGERPLENGEETA
jgi:hypothetical protein